MKDLLEFLVLESLNTLECSLSYTKKYRLSLLIFYKNKLNILIMKNTIHQPILGLLLIILFIFSSCEKDSNLIKPSSDALEIMIDINDCDAFNENIDHLTYFQSSTSESLPEKVGEEEVEIDTESNLRCKMQKMKYAPTYNELYLLDPRIGVFYPGSMIAGNSINNGAFTPLVFDRKPAILTISIPKLTGVSASVIVENPSLATVTDGINQLLADAIDSPSTPAKVNFDIEEIHSASQLTTSLQAKVEGWGGKIKGAYDFNNTKVQSRFLLKFHQVYYDISMGAVESPCDFFEGFPPLSKFEGQLPVYVSNVSYGRMVYFMIESEESATNVKKALEASFSKWKVDVEASISKEEEDVFKKSSTKGLIIGGDGDGAVGAINGIEGVKNFIRTGGNFSATSLGLPLSYTMRFLDNSTANVTLNSEYTIRKCDEISEDFILPLNNLTFDLCPELVKGDNEFAGHGPFVTGEITLVQGSNNPNEIYAQIDIKFKETENNNHKGDTEASINQRVHLFTVPEEYELKPLPNEPVHFTYTDDDKELDVPTHTGGNFIKKIEVNGDTSGGDLPCHGPSEDESYVSIYFKNYKVQVKRI